ncbi:MAG: serine/threonine-protein phosphatase [Oscillospiraceae bacterium]|nr:serine/threonine-protein phosphatase [Oscillospiraceae bacterium]
MLEISSSGTSNAGKRKLNEDNFYMNEIFIAENNASNGKIYTDTAQRDIQFYAVFDGLGKDVKSDITPETDYCDGENASYMAAHMLSVLQRHLKDKTQFNLNNYIHSFVHKTNKSICDYIMKKKVRAGVSFAMLCIFGNSAFVYNIGNSKVFLLRDNRLSLISQNDTKAEVLVTTRQIGADMVRHAPENKSLTQYLGIFENEKRIELHINRLNLKSGDKFLICSDGLCDLASERIYQIMSRDMSEQEIVSDLAYEAARGGESMKENLTVLVVGVSNPGETARKADALKPATDGPTHFTPLVFRNKFELKPKHVRHILFSAGLVVAFIIVLAIFFKSPEPQKTPNGGPGSEKTGESTKDPEQTPETPPTSKGMGNFVATTEHQTYDVPTIDPDAPAESTSAETTTTPQPTNPPPTEPPAQQTTAPPPPIQTNPPPPSTAPTETDLPLVPPPPATEAPTEPPTTETPTEPPATEATTTLPETEPPATEAPAEAPTDPPTEAPTEPPATEAPTEPPPPPSEEETIAAE